MMHLLVCLLLLLFSHYLFAYRKIKLPLFIGDGMTLQHNTKTKLWSWALRDEKVTAFFFVNKIDEYKIPIQLITVFDNSPFSEVWKSEDAL